MNQKGIAPIIFILGILLVSAGIIGGYFYIKTHYSQTPKEFSGNTPSTQNIKSTPQKTNMPSDTSSSAQPFTLPPRQKILSGPTYSPDHNHSAYVVQTTDSLETSNFYVVRDNIPGKQYGNIVTILTFSPDSQKLAYVAGSKGGKDYVVVVNNQETPTYEHAYSPTFSPDSKRFAYVAIRDGKQFVVLDGKEGKQYEYIPDRLTFSPDSNLLAYHTTTQQSTVSFVVLQDKEIGPYDNVGKLAFSPDSKQITFTAYKATRGGIFQEKIDVP